MKRAIYAIIAIFVSWLILDFVIHGIILAGAYAETTELWRPMEEMKMWLGYIVGLVAASVFVIIYAAFFVKKDMPTALKYGLLYGIGAGMSMGYGSYAVMPITYSIAITWFLGTIVEMVVAGIWLGVFIKPAPAKQKLAA